jgi:hypothetical protein
VRIRVTVRVLAPSRLAQLRTYTVSIGTLLHTWCGLLGLRNETAMSRVVDGLVENQKTMVGSQSNENDWFNIKTNHPQFDSCGNIGL